MKSKALTNGISKKVKIIIYLSSILILCVINPYSALAWSAGGLKSTIASIVVSMLMSSGAGVTNMEWLNQLNTAYGVESSIGTLENAISQGLLTESAGTLIDTGLSDAIMANSAYTDLGLDALFTTTADDALIQSGTVAASGGANIAAESIGAITLGTVGQAFVAVGAGIGLGVLAHHFIEKFKVNMFSGTDITDEQISNYIANGSYVCWNSVDYGSSFNKIYYVYDPSVFFQFNYLSSSGKRRTCLFSYDGQLHPYRSYQVYNNRWYDRSGSDADFLSESEYNWSPEVSYPYDSYVSGVRNGTIEPYKSYSPDVIGSDGNQRGTYDPETGYSFPFITPYYNPTEKGLTPIPMEDYMDFAQDAIDNTENGDVDELQGSLFDNFINPYLEQNDPVIPEPDPDYTNPDTIPEQPDYNDKVPVTAEDVQEADAYTAPDLMDRFPFCIPNDILSIFRKFKVGRQAPYIEWNFKYDAIGLDYTFELDLSIYDDAAQILRLMELIGFVVGLGVATRKLIGA